MISVAEALDHLFALVDPLDTEIIPLRQAAGRVLAKPVKAERAQPPFDASAMDGYAVFDADPRSGQRYEVIGEAAAGQAFQGAVGPDQSVRIFTGAPIPDGAGSIVIQEDAERHDSHMSVLDSHKPANYIRPAGGDFTKGAELSSPRRLRPVDLAIVAAMNTASVEVYRRPEVAIIATGDELVQPGEIPRDDQIVASNAIALAAMVEAEGARARILPIAKDTKPALELSFELAKGADLILTIGGASVGDHDLVGAVAADLGLKQSFYKVAMRPGKPLMSGKLDNAAMVGLPGNPVSSLVCGVVFILPMLRAMQGLPAAPAPREKAPLSSPLDQNGPREHYMRAVQNGAGLTAAKRQDSSLLSVMADANALIVRPPNDPSRSPGDVVEFLRLR